ncbi:MAG TPA: STAS/SEC14 domain-containing protein [Herpetosiphonaceae bacterium]
MESQEFVTRTSTIRLESNSLVRVTILPGAQQALDDARENGGVMQKIMQGRQFRALVDLRQMKSQDREAREYYTQPGHTPGLVAIALLIGSPMSRVIGNLYMGFSKSDIPTRLFTSEAEALQWLETFPIAEMQTQPR